MKKVFTPVLTLFALAASLSAQTVTVKGSVIDAQSKAPVSCASIAIKGTSSFVTSGDDGSFSIDAPAYGTLQVTFLGYATEDVELNGNASVEVGLTPDFDGLNEIVAVGYGTQRKGLLTGSTVHVDGAAITSLSPVNAIGALQSQTPGAFITQESGQPGSGYKVNIRGISTIVGDSEPLYVIDGVAGGSIDALNPADIESIEILKDAASTAIYSGRASNGVVLVTTKRGGSGRTSVSYEGFYGWQNLAKAPGLVSAKDYMKLYDQMLANEGQELTNWVEMLPEDQYAAITSGQRGGTDWFNELYKKGAATTNHTINVNGGTADHSFSVGLSYTGQDGILEADRSAGKAFERYNLRANTDNVVIRKRGLDILRIGETFNLTFSKRHGITEGEGSWNSIRNRLRANPLIPIYTPEGDFYTSASRDVLGYAFDDGSFSFANPILLDQSTPRGLNEARSLNLQGSAFIQFQPIKGLKLRSQLGAVLSAGTGSWREEEYAVNDEFFNETASNGRITGISSRISWENTLSYSLTAWKRHHFDFLVGHSLENWTLSQAFAGPTDARYAFSAIFGRFNYNYDDRYLLAVTFRTDGASNLSKGHQWAMFPSVSAGWIISNERWMKGAQNWLSFLKLRASWGKTGNSGLGALSYSTLVQGTFSGFGDKRFPEQTAHIEGIDNPDLGWETTKQINAGIDMRFFNSRLGLSFDSYIKNTSDLIVPECIPLAYGFQTACINGGKLRNRGFEFSIDWGKYTGDFQYGIKLNGSHNCNTVLYLPNQGEIISGQSDILGTGTGELYRIEAGRPLGFFYGYKTAGVFQTEEQIANYSGAKYDDAVPGDLMFVDINGDGVIDTDDRTMIGDPRPDFTAGLNLWFAYKGFDLGISGYGAFGQQIVRSYRSFTDCQKDNFTADMLNTWQGEGSSNRLPRLTYGSGRNWKQISDIYVENGDFFRISNVTLGYDFQRLFRGSVISKCRLYVAVQNPFTFTKYQGMDPEVGYGAGENWMQGIDLGCYPSPRTFLIGINLSF